MPSDAKGFTVNSCSLLNDCHVFIMVKVTVAIHYIYASSSHSLLNAALLVIFPAATGAAAIALIQTLK